MVFNVFFHYSMFYCQYLVAFFWSTLLLLELNIRLSLFGCLMPVYDVTATLKGMTATYAMWSKSSVQFWVSFFFFFLIFLMLAGIS